MSAVYDWLFDSTAMEWSLRFFHGSAIGQTLFVALWASLPWWRSRVGRALMVKSAALMIYFDWAEAVIHFGPFAHQQAISAALFGLILIGIWSQVGTISFEIWHGWRGHHSESAREPQHS